LGEIASSKKHQDQIQHTMKRVAVVLTLCCTLLTTLMVSGCVASIGNRNPSVTVGQQLIDLQKARESGAITEAEYQAEKKKLLGSN
jgi:Short C-terminal domain